MDTLPPFEETQPVPQESPTGSLPAFEDTKPVEEALPKFEETHPVEKYQTPGQKVATVAEGLAGPIGTAIETAPEPNDMVTSILSKSPLGIAALFAKKAMGQVPEADIVARQEANPVEHGVAKFVGSVGALAAAPELALAKNTPALTKIGSYALKGAIDMGLIQGADEISKAMLGHGDPQAPVSSALSHVGASMLLGFGTGEAFSAGLEGASAGLKAVEAAKLGTRLEKSLVEIGQKSISPEAITSISKKASEIAGIHLGGYPGLIIADKLGLHKVLEKVLVGPAAKKTSAYFGPMLLKVASTDKVKNLAQLMDYASAIELGNKATTKGVEALFKNVSNEALNYSTSDKEREKIRKFIESGGVDKQIVEENQTMMPEAQAYAKGGEIVPKQTDSIADHFPEQNVLLNAARGRISNYLSSVRPVQQPGAFIYDSNRKDPLKEREYNKALDLASKPLSILKHIKRGSLLPKHMQAFMAMYPDLHQHLSKKITEQMMKDKADNKPKPPYKIRQALSLFLGSTLDSSLTQPSMQAAQAVFAQQKATQPALKGSAVTKLDDSSLTSQQARQKRENKL